jgi:hypothetical protein
VVADAITDLAELQGSVQAEAFGAHGCMAIVLTIVGIWADMFAGDLRRLGCVQLEIIGPAISNYQR